MRVRYVNVYWVSRHYGGPEEGGWWFDSGEPELSKAVDPRKAERIRDRARERYERRNEEEGNRELGSVLGIGRWAVFLEDGPAQGFPEDRPRYE